MEWLIDFVSIGDKFKKEDYFIIVDLTVAVFRLILTSMHDILICLYFQDHFLFVL